MIKVITGQSNLQEDFKVKVAGKENGLNKLKLIPKEATQQITMAVIWVSDDGVIKRAMIQDFFGNENDITFTSLKFDVPLQDSLSSLPRPPAWKCRTAALKAQVNPASASCFSKFF